MTAFAAVHVPSAATASAAARRYVRKCLRSLGRDELIPAAERGIAKLTATCPPACTVTVQCLLDPTDGTVRITCSDDSPLLPLVWVAALRTAASARAEQLLGVLGRCGMDIHTGGEGKTLWFEPAAAVPTRPA